MQDSKEAKGRYQQKIAVCGVDPYAVKEMNVKKVPFNVTFARIYQFLVLDPNPYDGSPKECAKGMEAILYFKNGWVKNVSGKKIHDKFVIHGIVHHSFSLKEKPLRPWIIIHEDGRILAAHCDCAIGIMEACSHVGATLFALEGIRTAVVEKKVNFGILKLC